jgi:hypothetical protein
LTEQPVYDGDIFAAGATRLRYENLQHRRPRLQRSARRAHESPSLSTSKTIKQ